MLPVLLCLAACAEEVVEDIEEVVFDNDTLTGLYRNETGDRLCLVEHEEDRGTLGFVTAGDPPAACSGAGAALRDGQTLRISLTGDEECGFEAKLIDGRLTFPQSLPQSCAYYCSPTASFAGRSMTKAGDDASEARDLVGDPLCQ